MAEFHFFAKLPTELRFIIWKMALEDEAAARLVVLHRERVVPFKYLRSPFRVANTESRNLALGQFYTERLKVYRFVPWSGSISQELTQPYHQIETRGETEGTVFVSLYHDKFLIFQPDFGFNHPFVDLRGLKLPHTAQEFQNEWLDVNMYSRVASNPPSNKLGCVNHVSDELDYSVLQSIRNLVAVESWNHSIIENNNGKGQRGIEDFSYDDLETNYLWAAETFPMVHNNYLLWSFEGASDLDHRDQEHYMFDYLLKALAKADLSKTRLYDIRLWTWMSNDPSESPPEPHYLVDMERLSKAKEKSRELESAGVEDISYLNPPSQEKTMIDTSGHEAHNSGLSPSAAAGISVGSTIGGVLILGLMAFLMFRRGRGTAKKAADVEAGDRGKVKVRVRETGLSEIV
ncbi:hypothetical protein F5Y15DRAFT_426863 [Xylariaceae sp. FL0016]|nr:hypothetical protein F5Y15DRAFT_426863 [Xylariaceae sp. FL0016]